MRRQANSGRRDERGSDPRGCHRIDGARSGGPEIAFQLLVYPATRRELDTPSHRQFATDGYYILSRADMEWFWGHYLASDADAVNPLRLMRVLARVRTLLQGLAGGGVG